MLRRRILGDNKSFDDAISEQQLLPGPEEDALIDMIKVTAQINKPITHAQLKSQADYLCQQDRLAKQQAAVTLGVNWTTRFIKRHPEIKNSLCRQIDSACTQGVSVEAINTWFEQVGLITYPESTEEDADFYNFDETGFSIGTFGRSNVIIEACDKQAFREQSGRQEWATLIECICYDGTVLDPFASSPGNPFDTTTA